MTPEDVLIEAIVVASKDGDSPDLRRRQCGKLLQSIKATARFYLRGDGPPRENDEAA